MQRVKTTFVIAISTVFALTFAANQSVQAQTFKVIHDFTGGQDGANPYGGLTTDQAGNLYGTTWAGGYTGGNCVVRGTCGTVFKLSKKGSGWVFTPLYNFQGVPDGANPGARVIFGPDGSLYGTTGYEESPSG
jgi:hypothetical protein